MSKPASPRKVGDKEALAVGTTIRGSARKLNLVAGLIRGRKVEEALNILKFSPKGMSEDVYKVLASAVANAENNHNLDVDQLVVAEAWVGKGMVLKRGRPRARGRFGKIMKPFSEITIKVREVDAAAAEAAKKAARDKRVAAKPAATETAPEAAAEELA